LFIAEILDGASSRYALSIAVKNANRSYFAFLAEVRKNARRQHRAKYGLRTDIADAVKAHKGPAPEPLTLVRLVSQVDPGASRQYRGVGWAFVEQNTAARKEIQARKRGQIAVLSELADDILLRVEGR
jgi:hypothetical protein